MAVRSSYVAWHLITQISLPEFLGSMNVPAYTFSDMLQRLRLVRYAEHGNGLPKVLIGFSKEYV